MSAAATRTNRVEHDTNGFTQGAETSGPVKLEARAVVEDHGMRPLMRAASDGSAGTVRALLDRGADVNAKRTDGFNALALAAFFGHAQVVWLLVENGADLSATCRSETLPEMWADIRGFMDIGDTIREARAAKGMEAANPRTTVIAEPARFSRPEESKKFEPASVGDSRVEVSVITESLDPEATVVRPRAPVDQESESVIDATSESMLAIMPEPVVEEIQPVVIDAPSDPEATLIRPRALDEANASAIDPGADPEITLVSTPTLFSQDSTAQRVEPLEDVLPPVDPEHALHQPIIEPPVRVLKTLPEIEDPLPLVVPEFRPGSVFVARVTSSRTNLVALVLAVWLVCSALAVFLFPQILNSVADDRTEPVNKTTSLPTQSSNPIAGSEKSVSGSVETAPAATTEPANAPPLNEPEENATDSTTDTPANTGNIESTSRVEPVAVSEGSGGNDVARGATSISRSAAPVRKQRAVSRAAKYKQQAADEEPPKPAPLSVEVSPSSSVHAKPARSSGEVPGSQPPPLSIISDKPKSKVIQWP